MRVKRFFGADTRQAMRQVRDELGDDAAIISNKKVANGVEIICALDYDAANSSAQSFAEALKQADQGEALQRELDEARLRILSGAKFDAAASENPFQKKARLNQLGNWPNVEAITEQPSSLGSYAGTPYPDAGLVPRGDQVIQAMQSEIQNLRDLLKEQMREQDSYRNPTEALMRSRLLNSGFSEAYVNRLLKLIDVPEHADAATAWQQLLNHLKGELQTLDEEFIDRGGVVAVLGPTGVGKTTTLSKLAARYVLKHGVDGLALVTTDCYRIAAYEQLRTVGRILGVPVRVVDDNNPLDITLKSLRSKSLVLIDTAGLNVRDPNLKTQVDLLASTQARIRRFLVLPATSQARVLLDTYDAYRDAGLNGCILTKLDEALHLGEALGLVLEKRLPISYLTQGQKIPDDLQLATPAALMSRFAKDVERSEEV